MRKNSIRKLIHGILDLLPLFVIPIFAININQKSVEPIQVEVQEKISVDFNQKFNYQNYYSSSSSYGVQFTNNENGTWTVNGTPSQATNKNLFWYSPFVQGHIYILKGCPSNGGWSTYQLFLSGYATDLGNGVRFTSPNNNGANLQIGIQNGTYNALIFTPQLFDLTQMFGQGNEPTLEKFNTLFSNTYYDYTVSQKMLVDKPTPTTYDDTDIGSQFLYSLYISTDNYFNMNNVFNLNSVYSWFEMNIFGGSAPLSIYIVWNIIIYELVMDLLMLLYALFMFFIDACQKLIDKPLESIK